MEVQPERRNIPDTEQVPQQYLMIDILLLPPFYFFEYLRSSPVRHRVLLSGPLNSPKWEFSIKGR